MKKLGVLEVAGFVAAAGAVVQSTPSWWKKVNESERWQDGIFYFLCGAYGLVSSVALIQLIRIQLRVPEYGWTTQKVFHLMNFIVNGVRAIVFGFHKIVFLFRPKATRDSAELLACDCPVGCIPHPCANCAHQLQDRPITTVHCIPSHDQWRTGPLCPPAVRPVDRNC